VSIYKVDVRIVLAIAAIKPLLQIGELFDRSVIIPRREILKGARANKALGHACNHRTRL